MTESGTIAHVGKADFYGSDTSMSQVGGDPANPNFLDPYLHPNKQT